MKIDVTKLPNSQVEVRGELEADLFDVHIKKVKAEYVKNTELSGFRKGAAPENMVVKHVGENIILQKAAEQAVQELWPNILKDNNIEAIGAAEFHILKLAQGNDLVWKTIVSVMPEIELPDYKSIANKANGNKEEPQSDISDKEVDDTLAFIQKSRAKDEKLPELNDEFARTLGNYESLDALKKNIADGIKSEREQKARDAHKMKIAQAIADETKIDIPTLMITSEKEKMMHELQSSIAQMGLEWPKYLEHIKKTEEELKKDWNKDAEKRVKIALVLREIATKESIKPSTEEIEKSTEDLIARFGDAKLDRQRVRDYAYGILRNDKVFNLLESC